MDKYESAVLKIETNRKKYYLKNKDRFIDASKKRNKKLLQKDRKSFYASVYQRVLLWRKRNPDKVRAHRKIFVEIRAGRMKSEPCEICGTFPTQARHNDYSIPLEVRWLCKRHYVIHRQKLQGKSKQV